MLVQNLFEECFTNLLYPYDMSIALSSTINLLNAFDEVHMVKSILQKSVYNKCCCMRICQRYVKHSTNFHRTLYMLKLTTHFDTKT